MTTPFTDRDTNVSLLETTQPSRWGIRLRELATEATATPPETLDWKPKPPFWQRFRRGTAVPIAAAAAVFIAIVLFSIATVWLRPHSIEQDPAAQGALALSGAPDSAATTGATGSGGAYAAASGNGAGGSSTSGSSAGSGSGSSSSPSSSASGSTSSSTLYIHVVGEVNRPGVYELEPGARALAAIDAAGGATAGAVLSGLNLARPLTDGEQLVVPGAEQIQAGLVGGSAGGSAAASPSTSSAGGGLVSLNSADQTALESLPRVGPSLAQRIIDWRSANGGFQSIEQLLNVSGIGQKTFEQLSNLVTL